MKTFSTFSEYADKILEEQFKQAERIEEIKQKRDEAAVKAIVKTFTEQSEINNLEF